MNEEQKEAAIGLVVAFVGSNVDLYDPGYNADMQAAGKRVQARIEAGDSLHDIERIENAQGIEIVAFVREQLFSGGEVVAATPNKPVAAVTPRQPFCKRVYAWLQALLGVWLLLCVAGGARAQSKQDGLLP